MENNINSQIYDAQKTAEKSVSNMAVTEEKIKKNIFLSIRQIFVSVRQLWNLVSLLIQKQNAIEEDLRQLKKNNLQK